MTFKQRLNESLRGCRGVIHVGANDGREARDYHKHQLNVMWIEPIPEVFKRLKENIKDFPSQKAINALIVDKAGEYYHFNISDNHGVSSSIFDFAEHQKIWPRIQFIGSMYIQGTTLSTLVDDNTIDIGLYDGLILDTQGSELLVLMGATDLLKHFKFILIEVANFESYSKGCQLSDIEIFMNKNKFSEFARQTFAQKGSKKYFNVIYSNNHSTLASHQHEIAQAPKVNLETTSLKTIKLGL